MKVKKYVTIRSALFLILLAVFCVSAYMVASQLLQERNEDNAFAALITQVEAERAASAPSSSKEETPEQGGSEPGMLTAYASLFESNSDLFGWIEIEGTKLNYPVMYTPDDPEHYLRRAFDGSRSMSGVPFLDGRCFEGCGNYLIYGHHMKNGTMFASITSYAKEAFWQEHPVIRFDTLYETGTYEIVAAFYAKVYSADDVDVFRYYVYTDLSDPEVFAEYAEQIKGAALYDTGIEVAYGDQLLTLSTCEYHTANGRFVVVAKKADGV